MLFHRLAWQDARYLAKKSAGVKQDPNRIHHVRGRGHLHKQGSYLCQMTGHLTAMYTSDSTHRNFKFAITLDEGLDILQ